MRHETCLQNAQCTLQRDMGTGVECAARAVGKDVRVAHTVGHPAERLEIGRREVLGCTQHTSQIGELQAALELHAQLIHAAQDRGIYSTRSITDLQIPFP